jgi:hypothetical protein
MIADRAICVVIEVRHTTNEVGRLYATAISNAPSDECGSDANSADAEISAASVASWAVVSMSVL